jgi:hypothetical protein
MIQTDALPRIGSNPDRRSSTQETEKIDDIQNELDAIADEDADPEEESPCRAEYRPSFFKRPPQASISVSTRLSRHDRLCQKSV